MTHQTRRYDVVVIGGGISGLGAALESSRLGFDTLLLERGRVSQATSGNSLRIIHGGFRYLQTLDFRRVIKSLKDQNELLRTSPRYIRKLPCVMPLSPFGLKSKIPVSIASSLYNQISKSCIGRSNRCRVVSSSYIDKNIPLLKGRSKHGALLWYDAKLTDPGEFAASLVLRIRAEGGEVREGVAVQEIRESSSGIDLTVASGDGEGTIHARSVVNTTGPWIDRLKFNATTPQAKTWSLGFNVAFSKSLEERYAIGLQSSSGRLFFLVPRDSCSVLGTEYIPFSGDPSNVTVPESAIENFIGEFAAVMPEAELSMNDIAYVDSGVLPAINFDKRGSVNLYGDSRVYNKGRTVHVLSTKYTTFLSQGREAIRGVIPVLAKS